MFLHGCVFLNIYMSKYPAVFQCLHISFSQGFCVPVPLCSGVRGFHFILWSSICMSLTPCKSVSFCVLFFMHPCVVHPISPCFSVCIPPSLSVPESLPVFCIFYVLVSVHPSSLCFSVCASLSLKVLEFLHIQSLFNLLSVSSCFYVPTDLCVSVPEKPTTLSD